MEEERKSREDEFAYRYRRPSKFDSTGNLASTGPRLYGEMTKIGIETLAP